VLLKRSRSSGTPSLYPNAKVTDVTEVHNVSVEHADKGQKFYPLDNDVRMVSVKHLAKSSSARPMNTALELLCK